MACQTHTCGLYEVLNTYLMIPQQNENSIFFSSDVVNCAHMVKCSKQLNISSLVNNILVVTVFLHIS